MKNCFQQGKLVLNFIGELITRKRAINKICPTAHRWKNLFESFNLKLDKENYNTDKVLNLVKYSQPVANQEKKG